MINKLLLRIIFQLFSSLFNYKKLLIMLTPLFFCMCMFPKVTHGTPDVKTIMNTWTIQKGFPLVTVKREGKKILLKQETFMHNTELGDQILPSRFSFPF